METRLSSLSGDRQYGPDNGLQSKVVVEGAGHREREGERDREREARTGPQGKRRAEWRISFQSTDTLLNYSTLSPSDTHSPFPPTHTYTHTHHFNLTPFKWSTATLALQAALLTQIGNKLLSASHKNLVFKNCPFLYNYKTKANKYSNKQK